MQFTNPIWLLGLSGLLVPLAIHLLSRKEGKLIRIGSVRHLEETSTKQFKSIKLNEILLLILRSLLILWIVFLLSGLHWPGSDPGNKNWLLIEKGFEHDNDFITLRDSLKESGFEVKALSRDFPTLTDSVRESPDNYWSLIESLSKKSLNQVVIISSSRLIAFRGQQTVLPENFQWITKSLPEKEVVVSAKKSGYDSVWIRRGKFSAEQTEFETQKIKLTGESDAENADTLEIVMVSSKKFEYDRKIVLASLKAIQEFVPHHMSIQVYNTKEFKVDQPCAWLIWLSEDKVPEIQSNKIILRPSSSQTLLEREAYDQWVIHRRLSADVAVRENLTVSLSGVLFPETNSWQKANDNDIRMADEKVISTGESSAGAVTSDIGAIWIILISMTVLAERLIAYKRDQ